MSTEADTIDCRHWRVRPGKLHGHCTALNIIPSTGTCAACRERNKPIGNIMACQHRGRITRQAGCQTCAGSKTVNVHACSVHGECTISGSAGVRDCRTCDSRTAFLDG